jgi:catecholate siderophore receptor
MKNFRLRFPAFALVPLVVGLNTAAAEDALPDVPDRSAHDSDLDDVLITGGRTSGLPLLNQAVIDTPQTVTTIPEEVIQLQVDTDLRDVLRNDPSVSAHADEDNSQGTNVTIRGFSARYDMYLDGQLDVGPYYRDPFFLEAVEVLTGPSSVLFGRGSTGGAIEQVSKKPQLADFVDGTASVGTDRLKRITADGNVVLAEGVAFRMPVMAQESGVAGRDVVGTKRGGVAPSLGFGVGDAAQFILSDLYQQQWDKPDYGVPWIDSGNPKTDISQPAQIRPQNFYGFRSDFSHVDANILTAALRSQISDGLVLRNQLRFAVYNQSYREAEPGVGPIVAPGTPLDSVTVTRTERGGTIHQSVLDDLLTFTSTFHTFGVMHNAVFGFEAGRQTSDPTVYKFSGVPGTNLVTPDENQPFSGTYKPSSMVHFVADTEAAFATDTVELGQYWEINAAARWDRFDADYQNTVPTHVSFQHVDTKPSWRGCRGFQAARGRQCLRHVWHVIRPFRGRTFAECLHGSPGSRKQPHGRNGPEVGSQHAPVAFHRAVQDDHEQSARGVAPQSRAADPGRHGSQPGRRGPGAGLSDQPVAGAGRFHVPGCVDPEFAQRRSRLAIAECAP